MILYSLIYLPSAEISPSMQVNFLDSEKYFKYLNNLKTLLVNIFVKYIVISRLFLHRIEHNVTLSWWCRSIIMTICYSCCSLFKSLSHVRLCDPMDCSTLGFSILEFAQTHVHWVSDALQPSHPLFSSSPSAFNLSKHQCLFQWVSSSHQVAKVLELQHQSFQWIFRVNFL